MCPSFRSRGIRIVLEMSGRCQVPLAAGPLGRGNRPHPGILDAGLSQGVVHLGESPRLMIPHADSITDVKLRQSRKRLKKSFSVNPIRGSPEHNPFISKRRAQI
jgi:hypothetical protein